MHWLAIAAGAHAAISVSGLSDETSYTGPRSFTIDAPAGFVTTATLNGAAIPVGTSVSVSTAGFYELVVNETPEGGGVATEETFLFNLREPGRGSSETGLPAFTAAALVNDAPSAINTGRLELVAPAAFPEDRQRPVIALLENVDGTPLWLNARVEISGVPSSTIQLRRGFGYTFLPASTEQIVARAASLEVPRNFQVEDPGSGYVSIAGQIDQDMAFGEQTRILITADLTVAAGVTLQIGAGSLVLVAPAADIHVDGKLKVTATRSNPTTFAPSIPGEPWGGFFLQEPGSNIEMDGAILFGSGADQDWFDTNSGFSAHRDEQALFLVGPAGAQVLLNDCYLIENHGQLLHNDDGGDITLSRCLLQGASTCGELSGGTLTVDRSALLMFPDADPSFADADNDAIYLTSGEHLFTETVIGFTQDDGIDTGGSPSGYSASTTARSCWFESILHEGMANSGEKNVAAIDTVFFNCGQAFECGYGGPQSTMRRCLSVANLVGARFGDNYDWDYSGNHLSVTDSLLINNLYHDIWGYDWASWTYNAAEMDVAGTKMSSPEDLGRHPDGNAEFDPLADAALIAPYMPVPGSEVGIAITGLPRQSGIASYPDTFTIQLSTFSSEPVSTGYRLTGMTRLDGPELALASGRLDFAPGETKQTLALQLPPSESFALLRLALDSPVHAADTGGAVWFIRSGPSATPTLISRGASWNYHAQRAEPPAGWTGHPFDDSSWETGAMPIGYGDDDVVTELTPAERGPEDDRTTAVYFRRQFMVEDAAAVASLQLNLQRDDGAVVYLNGTEIARSNMDPGPVGYATLASGSAGSSSEEDIYYEIPISPAAMANLRSGTNVLAVEVHQSSLGSSDLSVDLELIATFSNRESGLLDLSSGAYLYWLDPSAALQGSTDLRRWTPIPAQSPFPVLTGDTHQFYRLILP